MEEAGEVVEDLLAWQAEHGKLTAVSASHRWNFLPE